MKLLNHQGETIFIENTRCSNNPIFPDAAGKVGEAKRDLSTYLSEAEAEKICLGGMGGDEGAEAKERSVFFLQKFI